MNEREFQDLLMQVVEEQGDQTDEEAVLPEVQSVRSFRSGMVLTSNHGFTVRFANGDEFEVTVVQSEVGHPEEEDEEEG